MKKTNLIAGTMLVFSLGAFTGMMTNQHTVSSLKLEMAEELQRYVNNIRYDKSQQEINVNVADWYIQEMEESIEELLYIEQETQYYE